MSTRTVDQMTTKLLICFVMTRYALTAVDGETSSEVQDEGEEEEEEEEE